MIAAQWVAPLVESDDVLETIAVQFERGIEALRAQRPILGCPLNNLAQEMNPLDAGSASAPRELSRCGASRTGGA
jgi:hypothetical protein